MAAAETTLRFSLLMWWSLMRGLRQRGGGVRESGAFLLGRRAGTVGRIEAILYYDDVDPNALTTGIVRLSGRAMNQVWERCANEGLELLADVHTHPGGAEQSQSDRDHPMSVLAGHIAIIVPNFAATAFNLQAVGHYRYLGSRRWLTAAPPRFRLFHVSFEASP